MADPSPIDDAQLAAAREVLHLQGLRVTQQRAVVLAALMRDHGDTTAQALHERLRAAHPSLGLATVYRTLGSLAAAGVIDALQHGHGTCYRWCAPGHHHHLTCVACHRVEEVRDCDVDAWAARIARERGYRDVSHVVELRGTCRDCAPS